MNVISVPFGRVHTTAGSSSTLSGTDAITSVSRLKVSVVPGIKNYIEVMQIKQLHRALQQLEVLRIKTYMDQMMMRH